MKKIAIFLLVIGIIIFGFFDACLMSYFQKTRDSLQTAKGRLGSIFFVIGVVLYLILTSFYKIKMKQTIKTGKNKKMEKNIMIMTNK